MSNRIAKIKNVLQDLDLLNKGPFENKYAVQENIVFFQSLKSVFSYYKWALTRAPYIDGEKVEEINDILPKWDHEMHRKLVELESRKFPGLLSPLMRAIVRFILNNITNKEWIIVANLGCGGMETERQVIKAISKGDETKKVVFIGIDRSQDAHSIAKKNLKRLGLLVSIYDVEKLDNQILEKLLSNERGRCVVVLCKNNIFDLRREFPQNTFDLVFHTLFKHHLNKEDKRKLDSVCVHLSKHVLEYDGYKSWPLILIPHTITGWAAPVFLNATIFSDLRYATKKQLRKNADDQWTLSFFKIGTYLRQKNTHGV